MSDRVSNTAKRILKILIYKYPVTKIGVEIAPKRANICDTCGRTSQKMANLPSEADRVGEQHVVGGEVGLRARPRRVPVG